ncbi:MAG: DUF3592 domain-containing protein [Gammaproteobacteria bacterium]|nr:DUF3592 domain-containing protein [Gammaproteobacteria bacterium]
MKGKVVLFLFTLPFFGVGVWMLFAISGQMMESWQMQSWVPVQAYLSDAGYETYPGDDTSTYKAFATYTYQYRGQEYANDRVAIAGGADNIGDYQTDLGRRLSTLWSRGELVQVYVNPENPNDSIIDRELRWGLMGFKAIFLFVFGGVGLGLIIRVLRARKPADTTDSIYQAQPWLLNDNWKTSAIRSSSKSSMYLTWGIAAFWNLISAPLPFVTYREIVEKDNYAALFALLFPLVGIGMIVWAARRTLEWRRFGAAPVVLDPFPGAIGGNVGGVIDINLPYVPGTVFRLTLTSIYSYSSGSGDNRSRRETAKWQNSQVAQAESAENGTRLVFRFDVPGDLAESDAKRSGNNYNLWRLNVQADLAGVDFDRDYEIPVYATGESSLDLSDYNMQSAGSEQSRLDDLVAKEIFEVRRGPSGTELFYPAGRNRLSALMGTIAGGVFAGAGWFLIFSEGQTVFGSVFAGIGSLIILGSLYAVTNSLLVVGEAGYLKTVRRVMGISVRTRKMLRNNFVRFSRRRSSQSQIGSKHVIHYSVYMVDKLGQKLVVGEGFRGEGETTAATHLIASELGLAVESGSTTSSAAAGFDVLTADR